MMKNACAALLVLAILIPVSAATQGGFGIYAVGDNGTVLRCDMSGWSAVSNLPQNRTFTDVWGSSLDDIYVAGSDTLLHFDGTSWERIMQIPLTTFLCVSGTHFANVYVGARYYGYGSDEGRVFHFDGVHWSEIPFDGEICSVVDIWASPGGGFYAIVACWDPLDRKNIYHVKSYKDGVLTEESMSYIGLTINDHMRICGGFDTLPLVSSYEDIPFAATGGVVHIEYPWGWDLLRRNEQCDLFESCPVWPYVWHGVWRAGTGDYWFVGDNGMAMHWTGGTYTVYNTGAGVTLRAVCALTSHDVYAVGDGGTIRCFDGSSWNPVASGTTANLRDIWGKIEWTSDVPDARASVEILPCYPNPFNPVTTIGYSIDRKGRVSLRIYDAAGRLVRTLLDEDREAGAHIASWDGLDNVGRRAASGVYLCNLEAAGGSATTKLVIMR